MLSYDDKVCDLRTDRMLMLAALLPSLGHEWLRPYIELLQVQRIDVVIYHRCMMIIVFLKFIVIAVLVVTATIINITSNASDLGRLPVERPARPRSAGTFSLTTSPLLTNSNAWPDVFFLMTATHCLT
jgi:hypothetical protein